MANIIERAEEYLKQSAETVKRVATSRWSTRAVLTSLVALGILLPGDATGQSLLKIYGINSCPVFGDDWMSKRHRDVGFIFEGSQHNPILSVGRALTITDVGEKRMIVTWFQAAGSKADSSTFLTHGGAASIFQGEKPVMFRDGQLYAAESWDTNDPKSIKQGDNSSAIVTFAGCDPLE